MARVTSEQIAKLMSNASGSSFDDVRDRALMWVFIATGAEPHDIAEMTTDDVDLEGGIAWLGTSTDQRSHALGRDATAALSAYLEARASRRDAGRLRLWLGKDEEMGAEAVVRVARERGARAGVGDVLHPPHAH